MYGGEEAEEVVVAILAVEVALDYISGRVFCGYFGRGRRPPIPDLCPSPSPRRSPSSSTVRRSIAEFGSVQQRSIARGHSFAPHHNG